MKWIFTTLALCLAQSAWSANTRPEFHREVQALHDKEIARHQVRTEEVLGDYQGVAAQGHRYRTTSYYDAQTGRLISRVERSADKPGAVHIVEVYLYDASGRLIRDYASIALPWSPDWPARIYINLHHYTGQLHAYRKHEFDGTVIYEFCEGQLDGRPVRISLFEDDLDKAHRSTADYKACFEGAALDWKRYASQPH